MLIGLAWIGFAIDRTWLGRKTSGAAWVIMGGVVLSNFRITPFESPVYDFVGEYLVPVAIPLLLFKADLRRIFRESGKVIITFSIAACSTVLGTVIGFYVLDLGALGPKVAGVYASGWIGGSVNFVAVSKAVEMTADEFIVALSASNVVSIMALLTLIVAPSIGIVRKFVPSRIMNGQISDDVAEVTEQKAQGTQLTHTSGALALSFVICAIAHHLSVALLIEQHSILLVTVLVLVIANLFPATMNKLKGDFDLGMLVMYIFFAAMGSATNATAFVDSGLILFFFGLIILVVHLMSVFLAAKLFKFDLAEAVVGSAAAFVGPAPTAAIAMTHGWKTLVTPGILCGIFGYIIGTFIGVILTAILG